MFEYLDDFVTDSPDIASLANDFDSTDWVATREQLHQRARAESTDPDFRHAQHKNIGHDRRGLGR